MPNSVGGNGAKRKLAEGKLVLCPSLGPPSDHLQA